jgi:hypothetical protein
MLRSEKGIGEHRFEGTKMMRGRVEPFIVPIVVHAIRQTTAVP